MNPAVPLAAFGIIAGTIAGIAAAERRREYYERPYGYGAPYAYEAPYGYQGYQGGYQGYQGYQAPYAYRAPRGYAPGGYAYPDANTPRDYSPSSGPAPQAPQSPGAM